MSKVRKRIAHGKKMKKPPVMRAHHKRRAVKLPQGVEYLPRGQAKYSTAKRHLQGGCLF